MPESHSFDELEPRPDDRTPEKPAGESPAEEVIAPTLEAAPTEPLTAPADRQPSGQPARRRWSWSTLVVGILLLVILATGTYFRFIGQNWDDFTHLHPDERFLTGVVSSLYPVANIDAYFNTAESTLNPNNQGAGFYVYGTLPLFVVKAASGIWADLTHDSSWTTYYGAQLVGRSVAAFADLATILFIFLIGRRLYSRWVGLLAAALYAWTVLPIQLSHFWTTDTFSTLPVVIGFWLAVRILDDGGWHNYIGFGVAFGAALASRINVAPLAGLAALATLVRLWPIFGVDFPVNRRQDLLTREGGGLILAALASLLTFRIAQPYAFNGPSFFGVLPNANWLAQMAEVSRQVSGQVDFPPNHQWTGRIRYLFAWQNMVLWGMGLPLGLAAWLGWAWAGIQTILRRPTWKRHLLPVVWVLAYFGWLGGGWVMTMRYYTPIYPFLILLAAWGLVTLVARSHRCVREAPGSVLRRAAFGASVALLVLVTGFTLAWAFGFTRIYTRELTRVSASHWILENLPADFSFTIVAEDGTSRMVNIGLPNDSVAGTNALIGNATRYFTDGAAKDIGFTAPITGTVTQIHAEYLGDPLQDDDTETLWVGLWDAHQHQLLGEGTITADFSQGDSPLGQSYEIALDRPVTLVEGLDYELRTRAEAGAPFTSAGVVIATEGPWDDPIPWKVCALPDGQAWSADTPPLAGMLSLDNLTNGFANTALHDCVGVDGYGMGWYQGLELFMAAEDNEQKRATMLDVLNNADYLTISSNRFYDSLTRLPMRFPMSQRYYENLFGGELGFELVKVFESTFTFGDLVVSDQVLPTYDVPAWLNEFEAEEAFHVYDHPVVFVFRKTENYDPEAVERFLYGMDLSSSADDSVWADGTRTVGVIPWTGAQASAAPTALMLTDAMREIQYSGGTWTDLYNENSPLNQSEPLAVIAWWVTMFLLGWVIWPALFVILPGLPDRAYPLAKIAGLLVVSWLSWLGASLRLRTWTREGLLLAILLVLLLSLALGWRRRDELIDYLRRHWRRMLAMEGLALLLFVAFLGVRLGNPDLWHPNFGGERPMDFSYLNAVLRSTIFPPYNPWYSGGYINYYYYGFVLMGTPIKLLGIMPSVGFNLILATWFSLTGMAAFSAAFNLAAAWRRPRRDGTAGAWYGNPWVAGIVAMLLAAVLGNLDDLRLIVAALARTGGWRPVVGDEFLPSLESIIAGIGNVFSGQPLNFSTHWWYWNPTRVMAHTGNAINEIPYFTFLYGDPHAHAAAMPVTLLALGWAINEVLTAAGTIHRRRTEAALALAFGALAVGILNATNYADWVTYSVLGVFALTLASYLWLREQRTAEDEPEIASPGRGWRVLGLFGGAALFYAWDAAKRLRPTGAALLRWIGQVAAFLLLGALVVAPFNYWYATADAVPQLWTGPRTPLWAYLDLNGVFLFLVISLLFWDTARWLRAVEVRRLVGKSALVIMTLIGLGWLVIITLVVGALGYSIALLALPLIFWATILFFRPGQAAVMRLIWALVVLAIALTFVVDIVVWAGDIGRQNTVFKFYLQVWLLLSVVGGAAFAWVLRTSESWRGWTQTLWRMAAVFLLMVATMYPVLATQAKWIDRMAPEAPHTLDGAAFMPYATQGEHGEWFSLREDYEMIHWLQQNIQGSPVVLEGQSEREYLWGSRVSMYTGLPTVIGYNFHQRQQHTLEPLSRLVQQRILNVNTLYNTTDIETAWRLLRIFDVAYIVVGQLERAYYSADGLAKFQQMAEQGLLDVAYEQGETRVYRVHDNAVLS